MELLGPSSPLQAGKMLSLVRELQQSALVDIPGKWQAARVNWLFFELYVLLSGRYTPDKVKQITPPFKQVSTWIQGLELYAALADVTLPCIIPSALCILPVFREEFRVALEGSHVPQHCGQHAFDGYFGLSCWLGRRVHHDNPLGFWMAERIHTKLLQKFTSEIKPRAQRIFSRVMGAAYAFRWQVTPLQHLSTLEHLQRVGPPAGDSGVSPLGRRRKGDLHIAPYFVPGTESKPPCAQLTPWDPLVHFVTKQLCWARELQRVGLRMTPVDGYGTRYILASGLSGSFLAAIWALLKQNFALGMGNPEALSDQGQRNDIIHILGSLIGGGRGSSGGGGGGLSLGLGGGSGATGGSTSALGVLSGFAGASLGGFGAMAAGTLGGGPGGVRSPRQVTDQLTQLLPLLLSTDVVRMNQSIGLVAKWLQDYSIVDYVALFRGAMLENYFIKSMPSDDATKGGSPGDQKVPLAYGQYLTLTQAIKNCSGSIQRGSASPLVWSQVHQSLMERADSASFQGCLYQLDWRQWRALVRLGGEPLTRALGRGLLDHATRHLETALGLLAQLHRSVLRKDIYQEILVHGAMALDHLAQQPEVKSMVPKLLDALRSGGLWLEYHRQVWLAMDAAAQEDLALAAQIQRVVGVIRNRGSREQIQKRIGEALLPAIYKYAVDGSSKKGPPSTLVPDQRRVFLERAQALPQACGLLLLSAQLWRGTEWVPHIQGFSTNLQLAIPALVVLNVAICEASLGWLEKGKALQPRLLLTQALQSMGLVVASMVLSGIRDLQESWNMAVLLVGAFAREAARYADIPDLETWMPYEAIRYAHHRLHEGSARTPRAYYT